jgi:Helicase HerA, central domain
MRTALWALDKIVGRKIAGHTRNHLAGIADTQVHASRHRTASLLERMASETGPHALLGETEWDQPVRLPLEYLVKAHSVITGGTGSGKTMAALLIIKAILESPETPLSLGVLDAKGELFERTLYLLSCKMDQLPNAEAEKLSQRIVIIDLSSQDPLTSYNIASPWSGSDLDFFANSRLDTLQELLPSGDGLSLRGSSIVKHVLRLLAEHHLPFSYFDRVLSSETFRTELLARSDDDDLKFYFRVHFPNESRATIAAVRARIASSLFGSLSIKLALSGQDAPDFRCLQDEGKIVLINCAGPNIPRTTARTLQALFLSDIRQAVFARSTQTPYLWVCDEAQNFFRTRQLRENMVDLLTMSRSFGSFFLYLTQNFSTAVQDGETLETFHTNIRWSLSLRGSSHDGAFLQTALPLTGRMRKPWANPYAQPEFYSPSEERGQLLGGLAHLPDRVGWLWLKSLTGEAMKIKTRTLKLPTGEAFQGTVGRLRADARIGHRTARDAYLAEIARRDGEYVTREEPDKIEQLKKSYREDQEVAR